jgi:Flp pilus assembly protein TadG
MKLKLLKNQKGIALVEMALLLPLLLIITFGIIEFSIVLWDQAVVTNASREGARTGIVWADPRITDGEIETVVANYCAGHLISFNGASVPTTTITRTGSSAGDPLTVTVNYNFDFLVISALIPPLGDGLNLSAQTIMRME